MVTAFDKAIAALLTSGLLWLNHKYGFEFATDPASVSVLSGMIIAAVVYFVPNKKKVDP